MTFDRTPDRTPDPRVHHLGRFSLGRCVATPGALELMRRERIGPQDILRRHQQGDWGTVDREDWQANDEALREGGRLLSAYGEGDSKLWVITEWDRSATTILLPSEY